MTDIDIDAIRQREQAADPGPWTAHPDGLVWSQQIADPVSGSPEVENAEFIAAARQDVPDLLAKVDELTAERAGLIKATATVIVDLGEANAALTQSREQAATYANAVDELTAELTRVREQWTLANDRADRLGAQLTAANRRADGLNADLRSAVKGNTAWANQTGLARALRSTYTGSELLDLHAFAVDQIDGEDTPREDPIGRLADALFAAMAMKQPAEVAAR